MICTSRFFFPHPLGKGGGMGARPAWLPNLYALAPHEPCDTKQATFSVWMQDDLFSHDAINSLLHTQLTPPGGRSSKKYNLIDLLDATVASQERGVPLGGAQRFVDAECILPRERSTRWDIRLTSRWVESMAGVNVAFSEANEMVDRLKRADNRCKNARCDWHAQVVFPGSPDQDPHVDDNTKQRGKRCFYTFILPLVNNPRAGGTHFPKLGRTFTSFGGALIFDGAVEHAGLGNRSQQNRYFLYAAIYTGKDANCD